MSLDIRQAKLYKTLDNERKYMGFTLIEIVVALSFFFSGIVFDAMVTGVIGSFVSVFLLRYLKDLLKRSQIKRRLFFYFSDLFAYKKKGLNIYSKFYL